MRLIDADALIEHLTKDPLFRFVENYGITGVINAAPTIDHVNHGKWEPYEFGDYHWHKCSVCGTADKYIETVRNGGDLESVRY